MSRDYSKKDSKKNLLPSNKQIKDVLSQLNSMLSGKHGIELSELGEKTRLQILKDVSKLSKEQISKILLDGLATKDFLNIKAAEALKGYEKDKNWVGKNERDDKNSPYNINSFGERIRGLPYEVIALYDRHNRFMGYWVGDKGSVEVKALRGTLYGGTSLHNHPKEDGRPLGGHFSGEDMRIGKFFGKTTMVVESEEGKYTMRLPKGWSKVSDSKLDNLSSKIRKAHQEAMTVAVKVYPLRASQNPKDKKVVDFYSRLMHSKVEDIYKSFAKSNGIKYEFTPYKGYESLKVSPISNLAKPLP